jgi:hypothetical protein
MNRILKIVFPLIAGLFVGLAFYAFLRIVLYYAAWPVSGILIVLGLVFMIIMQLGLALSPFLYDRSRRARLVVALMMAPCSLSLLEHGVHDLRTYCRQGSISLSGPIATAVVAAGFATYAAAYLLLFVGSRYSQPTTPPNNRVNPTAGGGLAVE